MPKQNIPSPNRSQGTQPLPASHPNCSDPGRAPITASFDTQLGDLRAWFTHFPRTGGASMKLVSGCIAKSPGRSGGG
jgi:hypothetical protein